MRAHLRLRPVGAALAAGAPGAGLGWARVRVTAALGSQGPVLLPGVSPVPAQGPALVWPGLVFRGVSSEGYVVACYAIKYKG